MQHMKSVYVREASAVGGDCGRCGGSGAGGAGGAGRRRAAAGAGALRGAAGNTGRPGPLAWRGTGWVVWKPYGQIIGLRDLYFYFS